MPESRALPYEWFSEYEVASYHRAQCQDGEAEPRRTDDATWRDLDVPAYLRLVGARVGILARQMLYHRLRMGQGASTFAAPLRGPTHPLPADTEKVRQQLRALEVDLTPLLFHHQQVQVPHWARHIAWAPVVVLLALLLPWVNFLAALHLGAAVPWVIAGYLAFNGWVQVKLHSTLTRWNRQRDGVVDMLVAAQALGALGQPPNEAVHPVLQRLQDQLTLVQRVLAELSPTWVERTPMLAEYANLFALQAYAELGARSARLQAHVPGLRAIYESVADCEAQLALLEHLQATPHHAWPRLFTPGPAQPVQHLSLQHMVNPLVEGAAPLTVDLKSQGAFVSGQNGVGKSTLLRGVGLNVMAARAFGFCYCRQAVLPDVPVVSSIQVEDSLHTADSLYMAEMRRAETLVHKMAALEGCGGAVFLIDEIFKGTNHAESVAAAAAVLEHLSSGGLVLVSSHNLVLAQLLAPRLAPWRLERVDGENQPRSLRLAPGVLTHTNGLLMMDHYAFPDSVRARASRVFRQLEGVSNSRPLTNQAL